VKVKLALLLLLSVGRLPALSAVPSTVPDVHTIAKAVDEHYNHLRSLQMEFTESYRGNGLDRTELGTL